MVVVRSTVEDGELAFMDSSSHFLADVPAYYRGLRLLRTRRIPKYTTVHFEVSAECAVFVGVPTGANPPTASVQLVFQPIKFASVENAISIYTAASREVMTPPITHSVLHTIKELSGHRDRTATILFIFRTHPSGVSGR